MALADDDYAAARNLMVDGQVRPNKVTDPRIVAAMRALPRERFVPAALAARAYSDEDVALGGGRHLMEPMVIARLVQMLAVAPGERVLVVAAGSGYGAAVLAGCGARVTALEEDPALLTLARAVLPQVAPAVAMAEGRLGEGWKPGAPYDAVLIEGAVAELPAAVLAQLRPEGGRLATVLKPSGRVGHATLCTSGGGGRLAQVAVFDCAVPLLPGFARVAGFVL